MSKKTQARAVTIDIEKYGGLQVAIAQGKVIASGRTTNEVIDRIQHDFPKIDIRAVEFFAVPKTFATIYVIRGVR